MTIKFRCEHCHKTVEAPDSAAGKRGKCPYCDHSSYIPRPVGEEEVLPLAPVDEAEERQRQKELEAIMEKERELLHEMGGEAEIPLEQRDDLKSEDLHHLVVNYCLDMLKGNIERAELEASKLKKFGQVAIRAVQDFQTGRASEPALSEAPREVLDGYLRGLRKIVG